MPKAALNESEIAAFDRIPIIFDVIDLAAHLIDRATPLTVDELGTALFRVPGDDGPVLLDALHRHRLITDRDLSRYVGLAWAMAERPDDVLSRGRWRQLFTAADYTEDGHRVPRPAAPQQFY